MINEREQPGGGGGKRPRGGAAESPGWSDQSGTDTITLLRTSGRQLLLRGTENWKAGARSVSECIFTDVRGVISLLIGHDASVAAR